MKSKKVELREAESRVVVIRGWGKWGDISQRAQTSSYKMNKFWDLIYSMVILMIHYPTNGTISYT